MRSLMRDGQCSVYRCSDCEWVRHEKRHLSGQEKKEDLKAAFHLHRCEENLPPMRVRRVEHLAKAS